MNYVVSLRLAVVFPPDRSRRTMWDHDKMMPLQFVLLLSLPSYPSILLGVSPGRCIEGAQGGEQIGRYEVCLSSPARAGLSKLPARRAHTQPRAASITWTGFARPVCRGGLGELHPAAEKNKSIFVLEFLAGRCLFLKGPFEAWRGASPWLRESDIHVRAPRPNPSHAAGIASCRRAVRARRGSIYVVVPCNPRTTSYLLCIERIVTAMGLCVQ